MHVLTIEELMRLTRTELFALYRDTLASLADYPESSIERARALENLETIRRVRTRRDFWP